MIMRIFLFVSVIIMALTQTGCAQWKDALNKAKQQIQKTTTDETGAGLKEALNVGVDAAVKQLSAQNGYLSSVYKIVIPEESKQIIAKVKLVPGFQDVETKLINQMNKAAEIAAKKATPIFVDAITQMTFNDAVAILKGQENAATQYLQNSSRTKLYTAFLPEIQNALDEVNARAYWKTVIDAYNKIPLVKKVNPSLDDYVNNKALDGLFGLIEVKEKGIRTDINQRTSDLLKRVFGDR